MGSVVSIETPAAPTYRERVSGVSLAVGVTREFDTPLLWICGRCLASCHGHTGDAGPSRVIILCFSSIGGVYLSTGT